MTLRLAVDGAELLYCRGTRDDGSECKQLLARRFASGGLVVVVKGETYDDRARVVVVCPACGTRARFYPTKRAA